MTLSSSEKETLLGLVGELGEVRFSEPMSAHTTLRVGGPVDAWIGGRTHGSDRKSGGASCGCKADIPN